MSTTNFYSLGYHNSPITKGVYGEFSKIQEEYQELCDAVEQDNKLLILNELSDLYGAMEAYVESLEVSFEDVKNLSSLTKRAFNSGVREGRDSYSSTGLHWPHS